MTRIIAIVGPTASGKTATSISVAERFGCEIVGCDSMQIYRDMNIGTAKPTKEEMRGVAHHLVGFLPPDEAFSAERYRELAGAAVSDIASRGKIPLLVGGTGLYLDTLLRAQNDGVPPACAEYRERLLSGIKTEQDIEALWQRLRGCDPESAEKIHKNNIKRVIRALEIYETTGKPKSYWDAISLEKAGEYDPLIIVLGFHNRETLYSRIDKRVDIMMEAGLPSEVRGLWERGYLRGEDTASSAIGYKEIVEYIEGKCTLAEATEAIKLASRRYAKRQLTWFNHEKDARVVYMDDELGRMRDTSGPVSEISDLIANFLRK